MNPSTTIALTTLAAICSADTVSHGKEATPLPPVPKPQQFNCTGNAYWEPRHAMRQAVKSDVRPTIDALLTNGSNRALALFYAIELEKYALAEELLWQGNCVSGKPHAGTTVLFALCGKARFGECGDWSGNALEVTAHPEQHKLVALALANGADVNEGSGYHLNTPLMQAARSGDIDTVELLLGAGADVNQRNADGMTALSWAACANRPEVVARLLSAGAIVNVPTTRCGAAVDAYCRTGCTELHIAALHGSSECIPLLLAAGSSIEAQDMFGRTPFILAPLSMSIPTVQALIEGGADIHANCRSSSTDSKPTPGYNALHQLKDRRRSAGTKGDDMYQFLIRAGVKPTP